MKDSSPWSWQPPKDTPEDAEGTCDARGWRDSRCCCAEPTLLPPPSTHLGDVSPRPCCRCHPPGRQGCAPVVLTPSPRCSCPRNPLPRGEGTEQRPGFQHAMVAHPPQPGETPLSTLFPLDKIHSFSCFGPKISCWRQGGCPPPTPERLFLPETAYGTSHSRIFSPLSTVKKRTQAALFLPPSSSSLGVLWFLFFCLSFGNRC